MVRLRNVGLSPAYRRSLHDAGSELLGRLRQRGQVVTRRTPPQVVDAWLEAVVEEAHAEGERLYWVTLGVLGIQRALKLSGPLLRGTWRSIQGWRSLRPVRSRVPITAFCLEGIVLWCFKAGWEVQGWIRRQWWSCGLALWLGFTGLLRPLEVLNLRVGDLSFSSNVAGAATDPGLVLVIRNPKTRRIWHRQFVLCNDTRLEKWLSWWVVDASRGRQLFPLTRYMWNKYFSIALHALGLDSCHFTLGSLRAGGATNHFRRFGNLGTLQFLGRWASSHTMQFYLQEAFSTHVEAQFSVRSQGLLATLNGHNAMLNSPPAGTARSFLRASPNAA